MKRHKIDQNLGLDCIFLLFGHDQLIPREWYRSTPYILLLGYNRMWPSGRRAVLDPQSMSIRASFFADFPLSCVSTTACAPGQTELLKDWLANP